MCGVGEDEIDPLSDVAVRKGIKDDPAFATVPDQALGAQYSQVLGRRRFRGPGSSGDVSDRELPSRQQRYRDPQTSRLAERVQRTRDRLDGVIPGDPRSGRGDCARSEPASVA